MHSNKNNPKFELGDKVRIKLPDHSSEHADLSSIKKIKKLLDSIINVKEFDPFENNLGTISYVLHVHQEPKAADYLSRSFHEPFWYQIEFDNVVNNNKRHTTVTLPEFVLEHEIALTPETDKAFRDILRDI